MSQSELEADHDLSSLMQELHGLGPTDPKPAEPSYHPTEALESPAVNADGARVHHLVQVVLSAAAASRATDEELAALAGIIMQKALPLRNAERESVLAESDLRTRQAQVYFNEGADYWRAIT